MNTQKSRLIVTAPIIAGAVLGLLFPIVAQSQKKQNSPQEQGSTGVSGTIFPQSKPPALKIGGKENTDVYLQSLNIQVEATGNIASTRYTMIFKNKTDRILEGELTFPLPDGRTVTYYALDINGKMREAVPVEKAKGTEVFEEIERRRVDPGLLEKVEGNNFRTRIYPIPAKGTRTVAIGYEEELALEKEMLRYRLPLAYTDTIEEFSVKATVWKSGAKPLVSESADELRFDKIGENYVASFARKNHRPARALNFALPAPADIPRVMTQSAQGSYYFLASVAPALETRKKVWDNDLAIIWDVSLSGSQRDLKRELDLLNIIFAEKKNANAHLYFLNNRFKKIANKGTSGGEYKVNNGKWDALKETLEAAVFDGGTDFSQINLNDIAGNEILFFSDGISTLGDADFIKNAEVKRPIHCVVSSAKADYSAMKLLAGKSKGKFINLSALSSEKLKGELLNETPLFLGAEHNNAVREVYPGIATPVYGDFSAAGISDAITADLTLLFGFGGKVEKRVAVTLNAKSAGKQGNAYKIWAQKKIAELDMNYEKNRAELTELGQRFGIVTRNTSLIVLETVDDYVRYNIEPPASEAELRAEYRRRIDGGDGQRRNDAELRIEPPTSEAELRAEYRRRTDGGDGRLGDVGARPHGAMNNRPFRNDDEDAPRGNRTALAVRDNEEDRPRGSMTTSAVNSPSSGAFTYSKGGGDPRARVTSADELERALIGSGWIDDFLSGSMGGGITQMGAGGYGFEAREQEKQARAADTLNWAVWFANDLRTWWNIDFSPPKPKYPTPDKAGGRLPETVPVRGGSVVSAAYMKKMTGKLAEDYKLYLNLRGDYANSPVFYFDMANWFYVNKDRETALRILTSIADLDLENASLYRLLGYRLKEYGEYAIEKYVCGKVVQWRPMEPQSHRDYALALADNGEAQAALDSLYGLLTKTYSKNIRIRSRGVEEVTVTEINRLLAKNPNLDKSKIYKPLLFDIAVDVRVVINWNMNSTDIDLHVVDPLGEECYYSHPKTRVGGRISADVTDGYGPEQFLLKNAVKGKYKVYVNYFSDRQVTNAGPSTIMAEIYTKYADKTEQRRVVCLQMSNAKRGEGGVVLVAEFDF